MHLCCSLVASTTFKPCYPTKRNIPSTRYFNREKELSDKIHVIYNCPRGGSTISLASKDSAQQYRLQQQHLLHLKSTFLSEALATRGLSIGPSLTDVSIPEGVKPPKEVDWDCCKSTRDDPKSCLYSFDAEINTKVICPSGTNKYISLKALNRLRRTDPTKVEPMWHSQYAILKSWFSDESPYSLLQFVGWKGFVISTLMLDLWNGFFLKGVLSLSILSMVLLVMPLMEVMLSRVMTSSILWTKWFSWGRFVHAALPLKILIGQMAWKFLAACFGKMENLVRDYIVELECNILEDRIPLTIPDSAGNKGVAV